MDDFHLINITYNYLNSSVSANNNYYDHKNLISYGLNLIIIGVGLPLTLAAIYALYSLVRSDHVAPIYVINLHISNLLQFSYMIVEVAQSDDMINIVFIFIYDFAVMASVYFMVCIALERYWVIAHPQWYHFRRTVKTSVAICVMVWVLSLVCVVLFYLFHTQVVRYIFITFSLLPFPLLIFFLVGTLKALSAAISVPSDEKRRSVGILVLVLLIYTLLILPMIIMVLVDSFNETLMILFLMLIKLSPLADLVLYFFMRKGTIDKLLASVCCCRMDSNQLSISMNDYIYS